MDAFQKMILAQKFCTGSILHDERVRLARAVLEPLIERADLGGGSVEDELERLCTDIEDALDRV